MNAISQSAGNLTVISSTAETGNDVSSTSTPPRAPRDGRITIAALIDAYMAQYAGRDPSRPQRLAWWAGRLGQVRLGDLTDDLIADALDHLATQRGRYWAGNDVDGKPIYRAKKRSFSGASVNRYGAALAAVLTWSIKKRIAPPGWASPMSGIERRLESRGRVRFLLAAERQALLYECQRSTWSKLYLLVLLALTTGARRGELEALRWADIDLDAALCTLHITKNNDRRILPLVAAAVEELKKHVAASSSLVFASRRRPDVPYNHVPAWHKALRDAGVRDFVFHDLRHSCASYLAQSGATLLEIAEVLGHRNLSVTRRYSHLTTMNKRNLVNRVLGDIK